MAVESVITETVIQLMDGTTTLRPKRVVMAATEEHAENTVGALRTELGLTGDICVNDDEASDATPIAADDRVVHVAGNKRGGNQ